MVDSKMVKENASVEFHAVIDRIEDNDIAVVLLGDGETAQMDLPVSFLPEAVGSGDHVRITITLDEESRRVAEQRIKAQQQRLEKQSGTKGQKVFKL